MNWLWQKSPGSPSDPVFAEVKAALEQVMSHPGETSRYIPRPADFLGADLGLSSIATARLAGILQKRRGGKPLPFHTLFVKPDGTMLRDITVAQLVAFLEDLQREDPS